MTAPSQTSSAQTSTRPRGSVNLTEGSIPAALTQMALPMAGGILATMTFNVVDTLFVSGLGEQALAALSFTFPVVMLVISLAIGLGAGTSSVVARAAGKHDEQTVRELITDAMSLTGLITIVVGIAGFFSLDLIFHYLGAEAEILPLIRDYMQWWFAGVIFMTMPMVAMAALRALGDAKLQGKFMILMAVGNIILDPLLIYGWWIFPRLEIEGAAIASLIVRVVAMFILFWHFHIRMHLLVNPFRLQRCIQSWKRILHVGLPAMGTNMIIPVSGSVIIAIVAQHGVEAVAGFGAATRVEAMALILFYALSAVIGPFCGQNLGAGNFQRLAEVQRVTAVFCFVSGLAVALFLLLARYPIARMFSDEAQVIDTIAMYLLFVPVSYFAYGIVMAVNASFNGIGKPLPGMLISIARVIVLLWPVVYVFNHWWGLTGIFVAIAIANILVGSLAYVWIVRTIASVSRKSAPQTPESTAIKST
ncbi:Multidrug export protein MepA [Thalassocella blandensis]|nr:Multidrug export protein MepA [Thalassocella blandensis]